DVLHASLRNILGRHALQQVTHASSSIPDCIRHDLGRRREMQAVDIAIAKAGDVESSLAERLRRNAPCGRYRTAGSVLLDNRRTMAEKRRQLGRGFARRTGANGDEIVSFHQLGHLTVGPRPRRYCIWSSASEKAFFSLRA